jgi:hypothetical protein
VPTTTRREPSERLEAAYHERDEALARLRQELTLLREAIGELREFSSPARPTDRPRLELVKGGEDA